VPLYGPIFGANFMKRSIDNISQESQDLTHTPVQSNVLNAAQSYSDASGDQNSTGDATYSIDNISQESQDSTVSTHTPVQSSVLNASQSYGDASGDQNSTGDATYSIDNISQESQDSTHTPVQSNVLDAAQSYSDASGDQNSTGDATYSTVVSDVDKLLFIAYREELLDVCCSESDYEWCWFAYFYRITNPGSELTFPMIFQEDLERSRYIECLLARERLDDAFECALRC
jgi:hypothetical protein